MFKNKKILFTILMVLLLLLIPNVVKAEEEYIAQIDVTIPAPVIGEKPATSNEICVRANNSKNLNFNSVMCAQMYSDAGLEIGKDDVWTDEIVDGLSPIYRYLLDDIRIGEYSGISDSCTILVNGKEWESAWISNTENGDFDITIWFKEANKQTKTISTIDITIPEPVGGQRVTAKEKIKVMLNGSIQTEIIDALWSGYDPNPSSNNAWGAGEFFEQGDGYKCQINFDFEKSYTFSSEVTINVNGKFHEKISSNELQSEYFDGYILHVDFGTVNSFEPDDDYYENEEEESISKIDIKIPFPTIGGKPCSLKDIIVMTGEGIKVKIDEINWYEGDPFVDDSWDIEVKEFEAGKKYSCMINLLLPSGEHLAGWPSILLNGKEYGSAGVEDVSVLDDRKSNLYNCYL